MDNTIDNISMYISIFIIAAGIIITITNIICMIINKKRYKDIIKSESKSNKHHSTVSNKSIKELIQSVLSRSSLDSMNFIDYFEKEMKEIKYVIKQSYRSDYDFILSTILPTIELSKLIGKEFDRLVELHMIESSKYEDETMKFNQKVGIYENTKIGAGDDKNNIDTDLINIFFEQNNENKSKD